MSAVAPSAAWVSPEEYLETERTSAVRREYVEGAVYAMAGGSDDHNRIARNVLSHLDAALADSRCEPFGSDMKLKMPSDYGDAFYYPDVMVVCDPTDSARFYRERPTLIFEVLSPDTERLDRAEKATAYFHIPTVQSYFLIEQSRMAITVLHRQKEGWRTEIVEGTGAVLRLPVINVELPFERIYRKTRLAEAGV
jgi:Uma2 family endonuclease